MVTEPQQLIPQSTAITSDPNTARRLYGPAQPADVGSPPGPETIYTVPAETRTTITSVIACNTDISSPPVVHTFSLSIGDDSPDTRIFSEVRVYHGEPLILAVDVTLEEGEYIQAPTTDVTLTINGREVAA